MRRQLFADGRRAPRVGFEPLDARRGRGRRFAEQVGEHEVAARDRRGRRPVGGHLEHAGVGHQPAAGAVRGQVHAPHLLPRHARQPVVLGEAAVHEGEVGGDQVVHPPVLVEQFAEIQLGLAGHGLSEPVVVLGIEAGVGAGRPQLVEAERLPREVAHEPVRPGVVEQPVDVSGEHRRVGQPARARRVEQPLVGHAAPQEVRQPRRQREVVEGAGVARLVEERGRAENRPQGHADGLDERPALGQQGFGEAGVGFELAVRERPAERPRREPRHDVDDVLVGRLRQADLAEVVELDAGEQVPGARRRPCVGFEQRPVDGQRPERDALAGVVLHAAVALGGIGRGREVDPRRKVEIGDREPDQVARPQIRRERHLPRPRQVERADQLVERRRDPRHLAAVHHHRHRRLRLVRIGVHGDAVAARQSRHEALRRAVERVGRTEVEERREGVVQLLDDAEAQGLRVLDDRQVLRVHVLDAVLGRLGTRIGADGRVQRAVGRLEIGAHVQRRHALVRGHRVEPARVGLRRQGLRQVEADRFVDPQQVLDGVGVLQPREPAQRRARAVAGREVGVDERPLQRRQGGLDDRRVRSADAAGRHFAALHPLVDAFPRAERGAVGQVMPQAADVERRRRPRAVARQARRLDERRHVRLERLGGGPARRGPRQQHREACGKRSIHPLHLFD